MYTLNELKDRLLSDLKEIAEQLQVGNFKRLSKQDLIYKILDQQAILPADQQPAKKPATIAPAAAATTTEAPATAPPVPDAEPVITEAAPATATPSRGTRGGAGRRRPAAAPVAEQPFTDVAAPAPAEATAAPVVAEATPDAPATPEAPAPETQQPTRYEVVEADEQNLANVSVAAEEAIAPPAETNPAQDTHSEGESAPVRHRRERVDRAGRPLPRREDRPATAVASADGDAATTPAAPAETATEPPATESTFERRETREQRFDRENRDGRDNQNRDRNGQPRNEFRENGQPRFTNDQPREARPINGNGATDQPRLSREERYAQREAQRQQRREERQRQGGDGQATGDSEWLRRW